MNAAKVWGVIQGVITARIHCHPVTPPRREPGNGRLVVPFGTTYGPMTYQEARDCASDLLYETTLCILPSGGLQAIHLDGLGLELARVKDAMGHMLPGMMFFPRAGEFSGDGKGILLIGYGEHFPDLQTEGVTASCSPGIAFPVGPAYARPERNRRDEDIRPGFAWKMPAANTLEDLAPLAAYLHSLRLTEADRLTFRRAQEAEKVEDQREMERTIDSWTKPQAQQKKRELLP